MDVMSDEEIPKYIKHTQLRVERTKTLLDLHASELNAFRRKWLEPKKFSSTTPKVSDNERLSNSTTPLKRPKKPILMSGVFEVICRKAQIVKGLQTDYNYIFATFDFTDEKYLDQRIWHTFPLPIKYQKKPDLFSKVKEDLDIERFLKSNRKSAAILESPSELVGLTGLVYMDIYKLPMYSDENRILAFIDFSQTDEMIASQIEAASKMHIVHHYDELPETAPKQTHSTP